MTTMQTPSGRPAVLLFHSSGASARQWDGLVEALRPRFEVHAIDLHGHGRQAPWTGGRAMSVADEAALALPLIERAGAVHLVGHSYGGAVALHLAALRPAQVRSLAVFEPVLFGLLAEHEPHGVAAREAFELAATMHALVAADRASAAAEHFVDYWSGAGAWSRLPPPAQQSVAARMPVIVSHFDALYAEAWPAARLARLTMPLLCLAGEGSTAAALRIAALLRGLLPGARHTALAGLGHLGPMTHPARVNPLLLHFLGVATGAPVSPLPALRPDPSTTLSLEHQA